MLNCLEYKIRYDIQEYKQSGTRDTELNRNHNGQLLVSRDIKSF